ncbi:hypothetical protein BX666DRAFT_1868111 [Dichotomocladium elegans]|nr:hypothetical protein BX666DRAFT_1868111 [Dichotomocladium elegans]
MLFGSIHPGISIRLAPAFVMSTQDLALFYALLLVVDYQLLRNESRLPLGKRQLRVLMMFGHAALPLVLVSRRHLDNMFLAGIPWFIVTYSAFAMPMDGISVFEWIDGVLSIVGVLFENANKGTHRLQGCVKVIRGSVKLLFSHVIIQPWLPADNRFLLSLGWFDLLSLLLTVLYGIKAYCTLGIVDVFMGLEQILLGVPLIDIFNSPILASR